MNKIYYVEVPVGILKQMLVSNIGREGMECILGAQDRVQY